VCQYYIHLSSVWGLGYYIEWIDIPWKRPQNNFQANPCRFDACAGLLVQGAGGRSGSELATAYVLTWNNLDIIYIYSSGSGMPKEQW